MLKIKLSPTGKKNATHYRIVVMPEKSKLTGRVNAILGHFHPSSGEITYDKSALSDWIKKGAQPTPRIRRLLKI